MMRKSVLLEVPPEAAFEIFTTQISAWWPPENRHTQDPASTLHLIPERFFEVASDGHEVELGKVREWQPPARILLDFYVATGPDRPTEVEVLFTAEGQGTRVSVRHGPKPESTEVWTERAPRYERAWVRVLAAFAAFSQNPDAAKAAP